MAERADVRGINHGLTTALIAARLRFWEDRISANEQQCCCDGPQALRGGSAAKGGTRDRMETRLGAFVPRASSLD
jgi:hypothetical protein